MSDRPFDSAPFGCAQGRQGSNPSSPDRSLDCARDKHPAWLTAEQIAAREGITPRSARRKYLRLADSMNGTRHLYLRKVSGGRGGREGHWQFQYEALKVAVPAPPAAALAVRPDALIERPAPQPAEQTLALPFDKPAVTEQLTTIPESARPLARARDRALQLLTSDEWKLWKNRTIHGVRIERLTDAIRALALDSKRAAAGHRGELAPWRDIQEDLRRERGDRMTFLPVSAGTLWRWWSWHRKGRTVRGVKLLPGIVALHDPPPATANRSLFFEQHVNGAVALLVKWKELSRGADANRRHLYDILVREWKSSIAESGPPPSYKTICRFLDNPDLIPAHVRDLACLGEREWRASKGPAIRRERPEEPMAWLVMDHRVHDVHLENTLFSTHRPGERVRLYKTLVVDWASEFITGFCFGPIPSSDSINSALYMTYSECGFSDFLYFDRGKDYDKARHNLLSDTALALLQEQRVEVTRALPFNAKAKPIESWFRRWSLRFDKEWEGYAGRTPQHRPHATALALHEHKQYLAGKRTSTALHTDREFIEFALLYIDELNDTPRPTLEGRTPREVFDARAPRPLPDRRLLDCLFATRDRRVVGRGGTVRLNNLVYEPVELYVAPVAGWQGEEIEIARNPFNLSTAVAFHPKTGTFLGELRIQPLAPMSAHGQDPLSRQAIAANARRVKKLRDQYRNFCAFLEYGAAALDIRTEIEYRAERALGTGTEGRLLDAAPGARQPRALAAEARPEIRSFACDVSDADAALLDQVEVDAPPEVKE